MSIVPQVDVEASRSCNNWNCCFKGRKNKEQKVITIPVLTPNSDQKMTYTVEQRVSIESDKTVKVYKECKKDE